MSTNFPEFIQFAKKWSEDLRSPGGPLRSLDLIWKKNLSKQFQNSCVGHHTYQLWHAELAQSDGEGLAFVVEGTSGFEARGLERWTKKTLTLAAEKDPVSTFMSNLANTIIHAEVAQLPGAYHFANVDVAEAFSAALLRFLL